MAPREDNVYPEAAPYHDAPETYHPPPLPPKQDVAMPYYHNVDPPPPPPSEGRTIFGLRRSTFWLVVSLILVVIIAAVGGGVGGTLAVQSARSDSNCATAAGAAAATTITQTVTQTGTSPTSASSGEPSPTSNVYIPKGPEEVDTVDNSCPSSGQLEVRGGAGKRFVKFSCSTTTDLQGNDIGGFMAYTLEQCVEACAAMNNMVGNTTCKGAILNKNMKARYEQGFQVNCLLKGAANSPSQKADWTAAALLE